MEMEEFVPGSGTGTVSTWTLKSGPSFTTTPALQWVGMSNRGVVAAGAMMQHSVESGEQLGICSEGIWGVSMAIVEHRGIRPQFPSAGPGLEEEHPAGTRLLKVSLHQLAQDGSEAIEQRRGRVTVGKKP
jgi:hypothetical protein